MTHQTSLGTTVYAQPLSHPLNLHIGAWVERQRDEEENTDSNADFTAYHVGLRARVSTFLSFIFVCERKRVNK